MTHAEEREIRRQRRLAKRQERDHHRAELQARRAKRENAKNGAGMVNHEDREPSYFEMRNYHPLKWCEVGQHPVRENLMRTTEVCIDCYEGGVKRGSKTISHKERASEGTGAIAREAGTAPASAPDDAQGKLF